MNALRGSIALALCCLVPGPEVAAQMDTPYPMPMAPALYGLASIEQLEYQAVDGADFARWDAFARYGGDYHRLWFRTEGEQATASVDGELEAQLHYSRLVAPFWEMQAGMRYERHVEAGDGHERAQFALTLQGTAPYRFDTTASLFFGGPDAVAARVTLTRDLLLTQRWLLRGRFEVEGASGADRALARLSGWRRIELGARLHFQVRRELMPYFGVSFERDLGNTADRASAGPEEGGDIRAVFGISAWF